MTYPRLRDMLRDVEFHGEYQRFFTQSSNIDRYRPATHCFVCNVASSLPKQHLPTRSMRRGTSGLFHACHTRKGGFFVSMPLTTQGFFFRAEVPSSTLLWLSVALFVCKTGEVKGQRDAVTSFSNVLRDRERPRVLLLLHCLAMVFIQHPVII